jgi:ketosteroid isomerase-like protein
MGPPKEVDMRLRWVAALVLGAMGAGLWIGLAAKGPESGAKVLLQADEDFAKTTAAKGLEGWLSFFAPDARIFPPGEGVIEGLPAIKAYYAKVGFDPRDLGWKPAGGELAASGDLGYTFGNSSWPGEDAKGAKVTRTGKYLTIWKKQADGSWRLVADIGNANPLPKS